MPQESERILGCQLWINLPAKDKITDPFYRDITSEDIEVIKKKNNYSLLLKDYLFKLLI